MIYVLSDIHGQKELFDRMLEEIKLTDNDTLYILGDVIDRGPDGIKALLKIMRMPNAKMLLGNHELMMLNYFNAETETLKDEYLRVWSWNGNDVTLAQLNGYAESTKERILRYLSKLPTEIDFNYNGKEYILCHASPDPSSYKNNPFRKKFSKSNYSSEREYAVWDRHFTFFDDKAFKNKTVIFGHTPVFNIDRVLPQRIRYFDSDTYPPASVDGTFIDIDCGCAYISYGDSGRLACLRLDDSKEFYIE